ncbi:MAG: hypothetical protein WBQ11_00530, partial [Isosphaeraceae bacterium]
AELASPRLQRGMSLSRHVGPNKGASQSAGGGLAIVPVVLVLTTTWLPRLFAGAERTDKQPAARNRSIDGTGAMCLARFSSRPCAWQVS